MAGEGNGADFSTRVEKLKRFESERGALVAGLIADYEELSVKYAQKCTDYQDELESRRLYQTKARRLEQTSTSSNFALAVLDGDGAIFQDYLLKQGREGGAEAAHLLQNELREHLKNLYPDANVSDWSLVVQVILNAQGLARTLHMNQITRNANDFAAFGCGFGAAQPLFSFIDVGDGKERADHKIRETLRLFLPNAQCKHIFFGPCHDNGYLPVLEPYCRDPSYATKLTLIETRAIEPGFVQLGLKRIAINQAFRTTDLPSKATMTAMRPSVAAFTPGGSNPSRPPPLFPPKPKSPSPSPSPARPADNSSWAAVGKGGVTTKSYDISAKPAVKKRYMLLNRYDERLDPALPRIDPKAQFRYDALRNANGKRNFCNSYHIHGACPDATCEYLHGEKLAPAEQNVLKHVARSLKCGKDACFDFHCYLGHHCKYGITCTKGGECRFYQSHGQDLEPAKRLYEDGTEEVVP